MVVVRDLRTVEVCMQKLRHFFNPILVQIVTYCTSLQFIFKIISPFFNNTAFIYRKFYFIFKVLDYTCSYAGHQFAVVDLPLLYESGKMVKYMHRTLVVVWYV